MNSYGIYNTTKGDNKSIIEYIGSNEKQFLTRIWQIVEGGRKL